MTETHLQLEIQRLECALDQMTRRWEAEADIARAAERLYRAIITEGTTTSGGLVGPAIANLGGAIRAAHSFDGGGR